MRGNTVGFVGIGRIGHKIARKIHGFGLRVIAYDPYVTSTYDPWIELVSLDDVLTKSNFIMVAASLTETSRDLLNEEQLGKVNGVYGIVNISRGGIIVESALRKALDEGRIGFAALDVRRRSRPTRTTTAHRPSERDPDAAHRRVLDRVAQGHPSRGRAAGADAARAGRPIARP